MSDQGLGQGRAYSPKLTTDEFLLHRSYYEKRRVSKLKTCNDPNGGLTKCLVCATATSEITYRCDHCLRLFHPTCWDIPTVPTRLWFCSLKCEEHMLLTGTISTRLPGVNPHLSASAVPAAELKRTLLRKRRLENPSGPAAKRGKGAGSSSPRGMEGEDYDDGDDDSIKTNSSKDGEDSEDCALSVKALIQRYTTKEVPCYLCGTCNCEGHSSDAVRDKLFARRTRAKRLKQLRNQCIQQVQRQRQEQQLQQEIQKNQVAQRYAKGRTKLAARMHQDPDQNIRQRTEEGIIDLVKMFQDGLDQALNTQQGLDLQQKRNSMAYQVRIRVTKMVEDVLKEYKSKIELQFQNTYRKQAKNMPSALYKQQIYAKHGYAGANQVMQAYSHQQAAIPMQQYARKTNGYRPHQSNSRSPDDNYHHYREIHTRARQKNVPFANTPSPSMSPETQPRPASTRSYVSDSSKRRSRNQRDTKPIIPNMIPHIPREKENDKENGATSMRESSHEVEASYLTSATRNGYAEMDFPNIQTSSANEIETKSEGSRLDSWGSSPLPLPPSNSNSQVEANLLAHNVVNQTQILKGVQTSFHPYQ